MGQCCSGLGGTRSSGSNEQTRLLAQDSDSPLNLRLQTSGYDSIPDMNTESSPTEVTIVQDKLKTVVQATAEHLMDISSIRMLDRLENNYAVQRSAEYRRALENAPQDDIVKELRLKRHPQTLIQLNPSTLIAPITTSSGHSISIHSLPSTTSVEQNEIDQFADYCSKISLALNNLKAKDTEVLIVPIS